MQRTKKSMKNLIYAIVGQIVGILISVVARYIFIRVLNEEYLGLNSLFSNILSMLSLVELGVGPAMIYSLYKPLAEGDTEKVKSLMQLYKRSYVTIGIIILILGIIITPSLPYLVEKMPNIEYINLIYILFVVNTAISYFYSYKRSLIIADQRRYITTFYRYIFYFILYAMQIVILVTTKNYILFLIFQIINTLIENIVVSRKADRLYPYLKEKNIEKLKKEDTAGIKKNIVAMVMHKVGSIVVSSTDNLIISRYVGLATVGLYSNYYLVISALNTVVVQIFTSITASIGNLGATEAKDRVYDVFKKINFMNFWIYGFSSICLMVLFNHFIQIWIGEEFIFELSVVGIIVVNFFITGMRKSCLVFRDALGLYWQDRYKPLFEAIINIVASVILVNKLGVVGVFLGTLISTITTCFWVEPYILYKHGMNKKVSRYFMKYAIYAIVVIIGGLITLMICDRFFYDVTIYNLIMRLLICLIVPNLFFYVSFCRTDEFKYFLKLIVDTATKLVSKIKKS